MKEDPRRTYFRFLHLLSMAIPNSAEKLLDEFEIPKDVPETTRKLMVEALDASLKKLKAIEERLTELKRKLEVDER